MMEFLEAFFLLRSGWFFLVDTLTDQLRQSISIFVP